MEVEAGHCNLIPSQLLVTDSRGFIKHNQVNNTDQMDSTVPLAMTLPESLFPYRQSNLRVPTSAKSSVCKSDGTGLSSCHVSDPRKRPRDFIHELNLIPANSLLQKKSCMEERCLSQIRQQKSEMDRFLVEQTEKMQLELEERRVRQSRMLAEAIHQEGMQKMKEKDKEIQRIGNLNWVLQERMRNLYAENRIWRELALTNEATANSLRTNLQQVLANAKGEDDAEPSSASNDIGWCKMAGKVGDTHVSAAKETAAVAAGCNEANWGGGDGDRKTMCKKCGERESSVLLLPCMHLCLCRICVSTMPSCPVCDSVIDASLQVNFS